MQFSDHKAVGLNFKQTTSSPRMKIKIDGFHVFINVSIQNMLHKITVHYF